jgi:hypothetical protein
MGSTSTLGLLASEGIFLGDKQGRVIDLGSGPTNYFVKYPLQAGRSIIYLILHWQGWLSSWTLRLEEE